AQADAVLTGPPAVPVCHLDQNIVHPGLETSCNIPVNTCQGVFLTSGLKPCLAEESIREGRTTPEGCFEVIEINAWQSPRIHLDDISKEGCELIIACRGQPHGFMLVARGVKPEGRGHRAEYHSQRVWEFGLVMKPQLSSGARHECGRPHIADVAGRND